MRFTALPIRLLAVVCLLLFVAVAPIAAQKGNSAKGGTTTSLASTAVGFEGTGTLTCADLNASTDPAFGHISTDWEFKIDPPAEGPFVLDGSTNGSELIGGMPANSNMWLTLDLSDDGKTINQFDLFFNSTTDITYLISAVIVKGGNKGTNVYPYNPLSYGDDGPFTVLGGKNAISHISFCFEGEGGTNPTAADSSVAGLVTDARGAGIPNARVQLFSLTTGASLTALTNSFGYYRFEALETGHSYMLNVAADGYSFSNSSSTFTLTGDRTVNFVAK